MLKQKKYYLLAGSRCSKVTSLEVPIRMGGPKEPEPQEVYI